jgi:hypothetical protein
MRVGRPGILVNYRKTFDALVQKIPFFDDPDAFSGNAGERQVGQQAGPR